ncbi:hypothetical protein [Streptomyces sp. SID12488]|uniref:hypothetical protein n=1 Tax=Streptomyces sp. SID12488 TaxID=2706040 RepID=UPI0013DD0E4B|nr:hypothetical protein [Streptomyces sp. SID12488]NEA61351.1 hypothetical protein [Streptomyces sp. SID12488]
MARPIATPFGPMDAVADWLRANDIDVTVVPIDGPIAIEPDTDGCGRRIRYAAHLRNEQGRKYVDETTGDVAQEERTTPLKIDPPANVQVTASS